MVFTKEDIYKLLNEIPDPEIPVISVVELGVVRDVEVHGESVVVKITPTYSGCPAMHRMELDIKHSLAHHGVKNFCVETIYSPAWTTDWLSAEAKEKLRVYGIAPPEKASSNKGFLLFGGAKTVHCPRCKSKHTEMVSEFGSTACKSMYKCLDCKEPFDYFKCI
ncbi:MAG TPA: 1,2-phenylacetyl-CoA epoxidase subunit PaaD [Flavobacteriales bacterium]|nr:1,2-phenylacetyl-CoA epoxidase subunit PaaD [Flavobacteriales bacterium]